MAASIVSLVSLIGQSQTAEAPSASSLRTSLRYEWLVWDMAYREECWPV